MLQSAPLAPLAALLRALAIAVLLGLAAAPLVHAQEGAMAPPQPEELIGARAFTANGTDVGEIAAITVTPGGEIGEVRMTTASPLGLGQRTVILPLGSIIVLRGAIVLDLSPSEVDALPSASESLKRPTSL